MGAQSPRAPNPKVKKTLCEHPPAERNPHCFDLNPFVQQTFVKENI